MAPKEKNHEAIERARTVKDVPWCEEYEAMISGMAFRCWESPILVDAQSRARRICNEYNYSYAPEGGADEPDILSKRVKMLKSLFGDVQGTPKIEIGFSVIYGCNTFIGRDFYGNCGLSIDDSAFVTIGDNVIIGPQVQFITLNHSSDVAERLAGVMYARPITIGSACWICSKAIILPGANIGYGCTIGAGAVVSGNIPEYSVAVGAPARVVKRVFPKSPLASTSAAGTIENSHGPSPQDENEKDEDEVKQSAPSDAY